MEDQILEAMDWNRLIKVMPENKYNWADEEEISRLDSMINLIEQCGAGNSE